MGSCKITVDELRKYLPANILSFGFPDHLTTEDSALLKGSFLTSVDIFAHRKQELIRDLSYPFEHLGFYDVVIDFGTIEHCVNPAQAFLHAANHVKVDGVVIHHLPLNQINHGYWNICPKFFHDFYRANNFKILRMDMTTDATYFDGKVEPWPSNNAIMNRHIIPYPALTLCVARRQNAMPAFLPKCEEQWFK